MALNAASMSSAMVTAISTSGGNPSSPFAEVDEFCLAISTAIVDYLPGVWKTNTIVWWVNHGHTAVGLNGTTLATSMKAEAASRGFIHIGGSTMWQEFCDALANGIVDYMSAENAYNVTGGLPHTHTITMSGTVLHYSYVLPLLTGFNVSSQYSWMTTILGGICSGFCSHINASAVLAYVAPGGDDHYHTHS